MTRYDYLLHYKVYGTIIHVGSALFPFVRKLNSPASKIEIAGYLH